MEKSKFSILYVIIFIFILLIVFSAYKNLKEHQKREYLVVNNKILESAKKCYLEEKCQGEITLKDLYDKDYLEIQIDPVTKENVNEKLCIKYENNEANFC